jgi:hypothetical protein
MSDKRTTPDSAESARRRKRAAPTIDLTATEVPATGHEEPPSEPPPADPAQPATDNEPESSPGTATVNDNSSRPSDLLNAPALAGGLIGAAAVAIALSALWFAGVVPVRYASPTDSSAQVVALEKQVRDLQNRQADPGVSERLAAVDNALRSLGIALTALNKRSEEVAARATASEKTLTELSDSVRDLTKNTSAGLSPTDVDIVQKRLSALEQAMRASTSDNPARLALVAAALRDAVASGLPFATELDRAKSLGADDKTVASLAPFAATGIPASAPLAQELRVLIPAMEKVPGTEAPGGFIERLEANAGKLVRIRPVGAAAGDDRSAVLARIEVAATNGDIAGALTDLGKLDDAVRAPAQDWIGKAQSRQAALAAARQFAADTLRAIGKP